MPDLDVIEDLTRLPAAAPEGPERPRPRSGADPARDARAFALVALRYLDVVLVVLATVPALMLGAPALGYLVAAVAWVAQRLLAQLDRRWIQGASEPRRQLGLNLFEAFGRIWLLAGAIVLAAAIGGRRDGLTAAIVTFCAYSVAFVIRVLSGPPGSPKPRKALAG